MRQQDDGSSEQHVSQALERWSNIVETNDQRSQGRYRLGERFSTFAGRATHDLNALTRAGANPDIILQILYSELWLSLSDDSHGTETQRAHERRRLTSKEFWIKQRRGLKKALGVLDEVTATGVYHMWAQLFAEDGRTGALDRTFRNIRKVRQSIENALNTIQELRLESGEWELDYGFRGPALTRARKKGRRRSGRHHLYLSYDLAAAELAMHIFRRTGQPHRARICRLLSAAGCDDFHGGGPDDIDRLRKRVEHVSMEPRMSYAVEARLTDYEAAHETRPPVRYGDLRTLLGRFQVIEEEEEK